MEQIVEQGMLYDFYGPLLTKHQQEVYELVVYQNLSLNEIAEQKKSCERLLEEADRLQDCAEAEKLRRIAQEIRTEL